ncbi:TMEM164 family-domain-containing protein [Spinellus fusiger]|nr:TMEM164 family-domain-containing protein [Spinellus fusiger]
MITVMSVLRRSLESFINRLEGWVLWVAVELPMETDWTQSTKGSWYIHPRQHAIEIFFLSTGFTVASVYFFHTLLQPGTMVQTLLAGFVPPGPASWTEKLLLQSLIASLGFTLKHKIQRKNTLFMLQPCHVNALLLILVLAWPNKQSSSLHLLFNVYLHTQWGGMAALAFPDLRDHILFGETFNFFAEHLLILLAPIYMMYSGRYLVLPSSPGMAMLSFSVYGLFHSPLLHLFALKSGLNLNYLFAPPPIGFLLKLGPMYRMALYGTAFVAMFATRYLIVDGILMVLPHKAMSIVSKGL